MSEIETFGQQETEKPGSRLTQWANEPLISDLKKILKTMADAAKKAGVKRFIFSSSCSVYGRSDKQTPLNESDLTNAITEYAKSKPVSILCLLQLLPLLYDIPVNAFA